MAQRRRAFARPGECFAIRESGSTRYLIVPQLALDDKIPIAALPLGRDGETEGAAADLNAGDRPGAAVRGDELANQRAET